jgi:hypothetical protein
MMRRVLLYALAYSHCGRVWERNKQDMELGGVAISLSSDPGRYFDNMSALEENGGAEDKTYTRDGVIIFLFDGFESLGCKNDFVMNVNLIVLNDLGRVNKLVGINFEFHDLAINHMCRNLWTCYIITQ